MDLTDFAALYCGSRTLCATYQTAIRTTARLATEALNGSAKLENLDVVKINLWLADLEKISPHKAHSRRRHIRALWQAAWEDGLAPPVGRLRRIWLPKKIPTALTLDQFAAVLKAVDGLRGFFNQTSVPRRTYFKSLLLSAWDTGLRLGDLRSIERQWVQPNGHIGIVQHKTGYVHRVAVRPETLEQIDLLLAGRRTGPIWVTLNGRNLQANIRKLSETAGVPLSFKLLRRSSASHVEAAAPGTGWRHLGHRSPSIAHEFYLDPAICSPSPTLPPACG